MYSVPGSELVQYVLSSQMTCHLSEEVLNCYLALKEETEAQLQSNKGLLGQGFTALISKSDTPGVIQPRSHPLTREWPSACHSILLCLSFPLPKHVNNRYRLHRFWARSGQKNYTEQPET